MNLFKIRDRRRFRRRLLSGSLRSRVSEAEVMLPELKAAIQSVHDRKQAAKLRYAVLLGGDYSDAPLPVVSPVLQTKANVYRLWAMLILLVEVFLAAYCASLTITGTWIVHLTAGIAATILFTGATKIGASTLVDSGRIEHSARLLERSLLWIVIAIGLVLILLFMGRFLASAELIFVIASSALSFLVALLVGICWTLGDVLAAPHREIVRFTRLSLLADELTDLHGLAERTARGEPKAVPHPETAPVPMKNRGGLTAVGLLLVTSLFAFPADALTIWVDVSGSLAPSEFDRVRDVLVEPLPLLEADSTLAIGTFATELDALTGPADRWRLPEQKKALCVPAETLFAATRKAREAACSRALEVAGEQWRKAADSILLKYREALSSIDISRQAPQTCLYPLLGRIISQAEHQLVITDGGHSGCGAAPDEPQQGGVGSIVILVPDSGGSGVAARMRQRQNRLQHLYPDLTVLPSWKVEDIDTLASHSGNGTEEQGSASSKKPNGSQ